MESLLKVVYNRRSKFFACIRSVWKKGESDRILCYTNSDCNGVYRSIMSETEVFCFNKLIDEIKRVIEIADGKDTVGYSQSLEIIFQRISIAESTVTLESKFITISIRIARANISLATSPTDGDIGNTNRR